MAKLYGVIQQPLDELVYRLSRGRTTASEWLSGLEIAMLTTTGARTGSRGPCQCSRCPTVTGPS